MAKLDLIREQLKGQKLDNRLKELAILEKESFLNAHQTVLLDEYQFVPNENVPRMDNNNEVLVETILNGSEVYSTSSNSL
uniref:Uncharacterized protein n=1 Tax=Acrobeloides nanus TaxID=290746 RepID=A0A914CVY1_9BILA